MIKNLFLNRYPQGTYLPFDKQHPDKWQTDFEEALSAGCDFVYVGGGDGTLNKLLPGLLKASRPIGLLPVGTGNLFSRNVLSIGGFIQTKNCLLFPDRYSLLSFSPGLSNNVPFLLMVGTGIDAEAVHRLALIEKHWLGRVSYVLSVLTSLLFSPLPRIEITTSESEGSKHLTDPLWCVVCRSPSYFPPIMVNPGWETETGLLSLTTVWGTGKRDLLMALLEIMAGRSHSRRIRRDIVRSVKLEGMGRCQIDGEETSLPQVVGVSEETLYFLSARKADIPG